MLMDIDQYEPFRLEDDFLKRYRSRPVHWGFGALSWVTYKRTYSRDGEEWWETCRRVIEGMITVEKIHCTERGLSWNEREARDFARRAYDRMWRFKWSPPGRGLWMMGTRFMYERGGEALNNCGFVSTRNIGSDFAEPFLWMFRMSMLGVGVGFDTRGRGKFIVQRPRTEEDDSCAINDSREGWIRALERLLQAYEGTDTLPANWDYSRIRPAGTPLESFGGYASGPEPLRKLLRSLRTLYDAHIGQKVDSQMIVDTMNLIGRCVVAGGIRRSAQVAFGDPGDSQFLDLKQDAEKVQSYRWVSNNSVFAEPGMDYSRVASRTIDNGEPGYLWLDNARAYGRLQDPPDHADEEAMGSNPCVEQTLHDRELCCLVETYPAHHHDFADYRRTLRVAYRYAKTVTLVPAAEPTTDRIMRQNRRIGCSMSGIVQAINRHGEKAFFRWCDRGYEYVQHLDQEYSQWLKVPRSLKTTSVKPSGTVSLLAGATPGIHFAHAPFYVRRVRVGDNHPLAEMCEDAGYRVEPDIYADNTSVIQFPVHVPGVKRAREDVGVAEKLRLAARMQWHWSDNQVSCTADFDPDEESKSIPSLLETYENHLKSIVFLPSRRHGYRQLPYETITEEEYRRQLSTIEPIRGELGHENRLEAGFCDGQACEGNRPPMGNQRPD
ncbi:MAG: fused protease/ribonucleoside-triphosphate reductase [Candidatus Brocadiia bacterium]